MSRWEHWSHGTSARSGFSDFLKENNPTGEGTGQSPSERAANMGLVSDGHGSYADPNTGEVVARTVNGELVFYDSGAGGGAVSDGEGGAEAYNDQADSTPIYRDPDTNMAVAIPARPEDDAAADSVRPPVPAKAPKKYSDFVADRSDSLRENYGDDKYDPDKLVKSLGKGYKYSETRQGKGDHGKKTLQVDGQDTDLEIGGAHKGSRRSSYSPSWADGHRKAVKTLKGIDREVESIKKSDVKKSDTAKRMEKKFNAATKDKASKIIADLTGKGRKTNVQGAGNKARRRMMGEEQHPDKITKDQVDTARDLGLSPGDAHELVHGDVQLDNPEQMGQLAGTFGRVQKDAGANSPVPDKEGVPSLYALMKKKQEAKKKLEESKSLGDTQQDLNRVSKEVKAGKQRVRDALNYGKEDVAKREQAAVDKKETKARSIKAQRAASDPIGDPDYNEQGRPDRVKDSYLRGVEANRFNNQ